MFDGLMVVWFLAIVIIVTLITYIALNAIDFSKFFKPNSTWQIRILIFFMSLALGFVIALGALEIIKQVDAIFE